MKKNLDNRELRDNPLPHPDNRASPVPFPLLFMPESATLAHLGRLLRLAALLPPERFAVTFACDPSLKSWIPKSFQWRPSTSLSPEEFRRRLDRGEPLLDETTIRLQVTEDFALFSEFMPRVVIGDFRPSLTISARVKGIYHINVLDPHWSPWANIPLRTPGPLKTWWSHLMGSWLSQRVVEAMLPVGLCVQARPINRVRRAYGLAPLRDIRQVYTAGDTVIYTGLEELVPTPGAPPSHHYIGPVLWEPPVEKPGWWTWLPPDVPRVFVSLGSTGDWEVFKNIVEALSQMPVVTLAATSRRGIIESVPNKVFVADYLPGMETCRTSDLVICNGGSGMVYQALAAGVPVMGIAANMDQMAVMTPVEERGAGRLIPSGTAKRFDWPKEITGLLSSAEAKKNAGILAKIIGEKSHPSAFPRILENLPNKV